jgi:hypothetical protein
MPRKKTTDEYYTASQVKKILNIKNSTLYNYVYKGALQRVIPPGRKQGVYLRSEVDALAKSLQTYFVVENASKPSESRRGDTVFETARSEDMEAEYALSQRAIGHTTMNDEVRRIWLNKNPESDFVVKHQGDVVAFFRLLPIKHERLMMFMRGEIRGWDISAEDVETFEPGKPVECIVMGVASEPDEDETTRKLYVSRLLRGVMRVLEKLGRKGIIITKIYATSDTPTGIAMSIHAKMTPFGNPIGKRLTFVLDVATSDLSILQPYKGGLAAWKAEQERGN